MKPAIGLSWISAAILAFAVYQYFQYYAATRTNPLSSTTEQYAKSVGDSDAAMSTLGKADSPEFQKALKQQAVMFGILDKDEMQHFMTVATAEARKAQTALGN